MLGKNQNSVYSTGPSCSNFAVTSQPFRKERKRNSTYSTDLGDCYLTLVRMTYKITAVPVDLDCFDKLEQLC